jgi:hypothetical protein
MSNFRNVENDGVWTRGGTYTFEFYRDGEDGGYGSCDIAGNPGILFTFNTLFSDDDGNFLFDNNDEDTTGGIEGTTTEAEDLGGGWWKYTITIPSGVSDGPYYLKAAKYEGCQVIT